MKFTVPTIGEKVIPRRNMKQWEKRGWEFIRAESDTAYVIRKRYSAWEQFEIRTRLLFKRAGFSDVINEVENFHYEELGPQIDVCGGVDNYFVVLDCTQSTRREPVSIQRKLHENHAKKKRIWDRLQRKKPGRYRTLLVAVCVEGVDPTPGDLEWSKDLGIPIIDSTFLAKCAQYVGTLGPTLRYHLLSRLGVRGIPIREGEKKVFEFPAIFLRAGETKLYSFCIDPGTLLKLAYVYRLDRFDEKGYQRDLQPPKLRNINNFLAGDGYFANNLVVCFDSPEVAFVKPNGRRFVDPPQGSLGKLRLPKQYCIAEVIDGQHRLYGYLDITTDPAIASQLEVRRGQDRLNVVAIQDPKEEERPQLFADINCHQTRVSMKSIWALMGDIRPTSLMGYIANLVKALNGKGPLRGKIFIPGKNVSRGRKINIANLGKGIKDRHLVTKTAGRDKLEWNLFDGSRTGEEYPEHPSSQVIRSFNTFLVALRSSAPADWKLQEKGFILTNNGLNVMLRLLVHILTTFHLRHVPFNRSNVKRLVGREIGNFLARKTPRQLRGSTSSEDGRKRIADEPWDRIGRRIRLVRSGARGRN